MTPQSDPEVALLSSSNRRTTLREAIPLLFTVLFFAVLFSHLLSTHMLQPKADGLYSAGTTWGDLAWHLSMISNFVQRGSAAVKENPIYPGTKLSYPFVPDLISAWMVKSGLSLRVSLILPSLLAIVGFIAAMYVLARSMGAGTIGAISALLLLLFNGSIFGTIYLWRDYHSSGASFASAVLRKDYSNIPEHNLWFSNFVCDYLLPQRAADWGCLIGTLVVIWLWLYWKTSNQKNLLYAGVLLSSLPLVHFHTFAALSIVAGLLLLIELLVEGRQWIPTLRAWAWFFPPIILVALPQVLWILPRQPGHFLRPVYGWMNAHESIWWFWFKNMSPHIFIFALACYFATRKVRTFYLASVALFGISNLVIFQPYDYDNLKLMYWWFLLSSILTGLMFDKFVRGSRRVGIPLSLIILATMISTGSVTVWRELHLSTQMFSFEDIELANFVKDHTRTDAIFLTSDRHTNPIACLGGRRIVMGYRGWLWSHGLDYRVRERDVAEMYRGSVRTESLLKQYHVDYVLIERDRIDEAHDNPEHFTAQFSIAYRSSNFTLVKVSP
ncbi:MAG TPA: hypothetical protein VHR84_13615 [Terriglobales bacterium]|jgi:hypothetical protein|nr:hypothetical protein [Terriglobales bacterium]